MTRATATAFAARRYWRRVLSEDLDDSSLAGLAGQQPRGQAQRECHAFKIEPRLAQAIDDLAGQDPEGVCAILIAALAVLIRGQTSAKRFCIGTAAVIEDDQEPLVRALPVHCDINGSSAFGALVDQVRASLDGAWVHQKVDPIDMREELRPGAQADRDLFLDAVVRLDPLQGPAWEGPHDLVFDVARNADSYSFEMHYRSELWTPSEAKALADRLLDLLSRILSQPEKPVASIQVTTDAEQANLADHGCGPFRTWAGPGTVHGCVLQTCEETPDATAVACLVDSEAVAHRSYAELAERASDLAARLVAAGVQPGDVIGVCLPRSPELIDAILAVMMTGGAWLPLDPDGPPRRNSDMLSTAGARLVFSMGARPSGIPDTIPVIDVAGSRSAPVSLPEISENHLAYVLFTSGSTGQPKGVAVPHSAALNYLHWCTDIYPLGPGRLTPLHGPVTADLTITALLGPLMAGGTVLLAPDTSGLEPLAEVLGSGLPLGTLKLTPTHMTAISHGMSDDGSDVPPECLVVGGEVFKSSLAELWQHHGKPGRIINEYGPTETVVGCTAWQIPDTGAGAGAVPIGRPIDNASAHVVNADLQRVPAGATGELVIGGAGVSHGYLGRPAATAERFVPDPFSDKPGARMYRTGDVAWRDDEGVLHCGGRLDAQVKIRGVRVEPAEVETVLETVEGIAEAVVVPWNRRGTTNLVAYLVMDGLAGPLSAIRSALHDALPQEMHPAHTMVVDAIPRMANGKLDHAGLPAPCGQTGGANGTNQTRPLGEVEEALAEIWQHTLDCGDVSRQDNFFEMGGDSILSVHVVAEARARGMHLKLSDIFDHPTLSQLALRVRQEQTGIAAETPMDSDLELLPIQRWWLGQDPQDPDSFSQSILLSLSDEVDADSLNAALSALVEHHLPLRVTFRHEPNGWSQRLGPPPQEPVLWLVDLSGLSKSDQDAAMADAAAQARGSLNLESGRLLAAVQFRVDGTSRLLLVIHHLVCDPASWHVIIDDLARAAQQISAGEPVDLPPASLTPWEWAGKLKASSADRIEERGGHGTRPAVQALPEGNDCGDVLHTFDSGMTARVLRQVPEAYPVRPEELLLAAAARVLGHWSSDGHVRLDQERHGREAQSTGVDFSRATGWFAVLKPVHLNVVAPVDALLGEVRATLRSDADDWTNAFDTYDQNPGWSRTEGFAFNFMGRIGDSGPTDRGFAPVEAPPGVLHGSDMDLPFRIVIETVAAGDALQCRIRYRALDAELAATLLQDYAAEVEHLAEHCLSASAPSYRPSEFGLADLDQSDLDRVAAAIAGGDEAAKLPPRS